MHNKGFRNRNLHNILYICVHADRFATVFVVEANKTQHESQLNFVQEAVVPDSQSFACILTMAYICLVHRWHDQWLVNNLNSDLGSCSAICSLVVVIQPSYVITDSLPTTALYLVWFFLKVPKMNSDSRHIHSRM